MSGYSPTISDCAGDSYWSMKNALPSSRVVIWGEYFIFQHSQNSSPVNGNAPLAEIVFGVNGFASVHMLCRSAWP